jgi:hypothetical protein
MIIIIWMVYYRGSKAMMKMSWMALIGTAIGALTYIVANLMLIPDSCCQLYPTDRNEL